MNNVTFRLPQEFVDTYTEKKPPFGFNGVGEFTFYRTYSHTKEDGSNESWTEVVQRVVDETYTIQKRFALENDRPWSDEKATRSAMEMYDRMWNIKFLPPGRGLWAMGAPVTRERENYMALQNCAFTTTEYISENPSEPFEFMMDVSMLGVGCGFDTEGAGKVAIYDPDKVISERWYIIPDTREGWVESVGLLIESYLSPGKNTLHFNYDNIRPAGEPIKGFGGIASGPEPLKELHQNIRDQFAGRRGEIITSRDITDLMNLIGQCVVAGNVRRTAQLAIGDPNDEEYLDLKNYKVNPERAAYGWTSNNSIAATPGMNYHNAAERTRINGEPGYIWLDNARGHGRIGHPLDFLFCRVDKVKGFNPCVEQPLEDKEVCTLVETFPGNHETIEDYFRTLKYAFLYAKTVTLAPIKRWKQTAEVVEKNRRIGTGMTGIIQAIEKFGEQAFFEMADEGYKEIRSWDRLYSIWLGVNESIRVTTVKPSGTTSLLGGATPGLHRAESEYYIRRVRIAKSSPILPLMIEGGYDVEVSVNDPNTYVVSFPVHVENVGRTIDESNIREQVELAARMQSAWSDNGVSVTVTFRPEEGHLIEPLLEEFDGRLKAISFLPKFEGGAFPQMPYETIDKETYERMSAPLKKIDWSVLHGSEAEGEAGCTTDVCEIKFDMA